MIDAGTTAAVAPVLPTIPANAVVALWFGFNGGNLTLKGEDQATSVVPAASSAAERVGHGPFDTGICGFDVLR